MLFSSVLTLLGLLILNEARLPAGDWKGKHRIPELPCLVTHFSEDVQDKREYFSAQEGYNQQFCVLVDPTIDYVLPVGPCIQLLCQILLHIG